MELDRVALQNRVNDQYQRDHDALGERRTRDMLDRAKQWDLSGVLKGGGVISFAHVSVADCGLHVAAAVNACLDSGADTVVAISVLHAFTEEMELARRAVADGGRPQDHEMWGIQGPGLDFREEWRGDHAMRSLRHFWQAATSRKGSSGKRLVERYPYLAGGRPEDLPNLDEIENLARDAVIVATGDQFHHGIAYGTPEAEAHQPDTEGMQAATLSMEMGIELIDAGDYWGYNQHCVTAKSDDRDVAQLYRFLRGPLCGELVDIGWSDTTDLYQQPAPSWAAGGFIAFERVV